MRIQYDMELREAKERAWYIGDYFGLLIAMVCMGFAAATMVGMVVGFVKWLLG